MRSLRKHNMLLVSEWTIPRLLEPLPINKVLFLKLVKKYKLDGDFVNNILNFGYHVPKGENHVLVSRLVDKRDLIHKVYISDNVLACDCATYKFRGRLTERPCNHMLFVMAYGLLPQEYFLSYAI